MLDDLISSSVSAAAADIFGLLALLELRSVSDEFGIAVEVFIVLVRG